MRLQISDWFDDMPLWWALIGKGAASQAVCLTYSFLAYVSMMPLPCKRSNSM